MIQNDKTTDARKRVAENTPVARGATAENN